MSIYETTEEAERRLFDTVVVFDGKPAKVAQIGGRGPDDIWATFRTFPERKTYDEIILTDPRVNIREIPLGYVNMSGGALYLERMPVRRYQQGLTRNNVNISVERYNGPMPGWQDIYFSSAFKDTINNLYPDMAEAVSRLNAPDAPASVAIKRDLAIRKDRLRNDFELLYKNKPIAYGNIQNFILPEEFSYLKELCGRCGLRVS